MTRRTPNARYGMQALSHLLPGVVQSRIGKEGSIEGRLIAYWRQIVSPEIAATAVPLKLVFPKGESTGAVLHLLVTGGEAVLLHYQQGVIMEQLTTYFGYPLVKSIKFIQSSQKDNIYNSSLTRDKKARHDLSTEQQQQLARVSDEPLRLALQKIGELL